MPKVYKSSRQVFARFANLIKPQNSTWRADAPEWVNTALKDIGNGSNLKYEYRVIQVRNHRFKAPISVKSINKIYANGIELPLYREDRQVWYRVSIDHPNYIETSFQTGEVKVLVTTLNIDDDGYPCIPEDNTGDIEEYLFYYILRNWLMQGNTHPIFKYDIIDSKIEGPIGRRDLGLRFAARNAMKRLDPAELDNLAEKSIGLYRTTDKYNIDNIKQQLPDDPNYNFN